MRQLIYRSTAARRFGVQALVQLLVEARKANAAQGITGALVYEAGTFLQVIEGDNRAVEGLMARIVRDPRHSDIEVLADGPIEARRFTAWRMALVEFERVTAGWRGDHAAPATLKAVCGRDDCLTLIDALCEGLPHVGP